MDDSISRQAAIDLLKQMRKDGDMIPWEGKDVFARIRKLPSAQPERKTGRWVPVTNGRGGHECDKCHEHAPSWTTGEEHLTNYCPNCGADMRGEQDDESRSNSNAQTDTKARGMGATDKSSGI